MEGMFMIKISVNFDAKINFRWQHYRRRQLVSFNRGGSRTLEPEPEKMAYLVNKYGRNLSVQPFGYTVEMPENAVLALEYLAYANDTPSLEELDEIVKTGKTEIHRFVEKLGFNPDSNCEIGSLFSKVELHNDASFSLSLKDFPMVELHFKDRLDFIRFNAKEANAEFLGRVLRDEISEDEYEMLRGISVLGMKTQRKYMRLLSKGELAMDQLAKALFRAASSSYDRILWKRIVEWLRRNGYENYAGQIIVKKTLM